MTTLVATVRVFQETWYLLKPNGPWAEKRGEREAKDTYSNRREGDSRNEGRLMMERRKRGFETPQPRVTMSPGIERKALAVGL